MKKELGAQELRAADSAEPDAAKALRDRAEWEVVAAGWCRFPAHGALAGATSRSLQRVWQNPVHQPFTSCAGPAKHPGISPRAHREGASTSPPSPVPPCPNISIRKILNAIGSGPIVIGQACEFDYSGTQACRRSCAARATEVILVNSNPATIMTDPELSRRHLHRAAGARGGREDRRARAAGRAASHRRRPDRDQPGDRALHERGVARAQCGVEVLGANIAALDLGEDRLLFKEAMEEIGLKVPKSRLRRRASKKPTRSSPSVGYPLIIRPSFTLGGEGAAWPTTGRSSRRSSTVGDPGEPGRPRCSIEQSVLGWKEFELEVMRDQADNAIVVCSVENVDADGRAHRRLDHRGAAADARPTVSTRLMRDEAFQVIRRGRRGHRRLQHPVRRPSAHRRAGGDRDESAGVAQLGPGAPRRPASRSPRSPRCWPSATPSTRSPNDITGKTFAAFEPTLDYTVVKIPRWAFEKFPATPSQVLGTSMKSVGEVMAIGRHLPARP